MLTQMVRSGRQEWLRIVSDQSSEVCYIFIQGKLLLTPKEQVKNPTYTVLRRATARYPRVRVRVTLRLTVSQPVCLGVEPLLGLKTRFWILYIDSLTRGWVCHLSVVFVMIFMMCQNIYIGIYTIHSKDMYNMYKASVSPAFVKQIMPYLT
jgi:hypothetical protein